jgi:hypothetical protein
MVSPLIKSSVGIVILFITTLLPVAKAAENITVEINRQAKLSHSELAALKQTFRIQNIRYHSGQVRLSLLPRTGTTAPLLPILTSKRNNTVHLARKYQVDGKPVHLKVLISSQQAWQREHIRVTVEVRSTEKFFSISTDSEKVTGFDVLTSPVIRATTRINGKPRYVRRMSWHLNSLLAGTHAIELPAVRYNSGGRVKQLIRLPRLRFHVSSLPRYIPPLMPVGKIEVKAALDSDYVNPGKLGFLRLTIKSAGIQARQLPGLQKYLVSNSELVFLPAEVRKQNSATVDLINGSVTYRVPFKTRRSGSIHLPRLELQYFDPDTGVIRKYQYALPPVFGLAWYWRTLAALLALWLLAVVVRASWRRWLRYRRYRILINQAFQLLASTRDSASIRQALGLVASAEGWHANTSLTEWLRFYTRYHGKERDLSQTLNEISRAIYAGEDVDLHDTATRLQQLISRNRYNLFTCPRRLDLDIRSQ